MRYQYTITASINELYQLTINIQLALFDINIPKNGVY